MADYAIAPGATSVSILMFLHDPVTNGPNTGLTIANLDMSYTRAGAADVTVNAVALATVATAYTAGRMIEIDATNSPGVYRADFADAAYATGVYSINLTILDVSGNVINSSTVNPNTQVGIPVSLDSGTATIAGMLQKMADDNDGSDFDAGTDSLEKITTAVAAGFPQNINADVEPAGGILTTGTNTANDSDSTWADDGAYWQTAATTAVGGFGLNQHQVFTLGLTVKPSILRVNAKETLTGVVHVWLYDYPSADWEQVSDADTAISGNADKTFTYIINGRHQQASDGEVKVRYTSTSEESNKYLYLDLVVIQAVAVSDLTAAEIAQAVWEADLATVHGAFPNSAGHILQDTFAVVTTVGTGDTTTSFTLTAGQATNDCYNGMIIVIEDATDSHYEARRIVDYTNGRVVTVDRAFSFTPAAGDHAEIVNISYADVNVTHLAASAIQQASGYMKVSNGTGTGQISLSSGTVNINGLAAASAAKLDDILDGTGGTGIKVSTIEATSTTTLTGAVSLGSTLGVTGATTLASLGVTGALTTGSITNNGTLTQTGAVTLSSTLATGAVTLSGLAITNALSVGTTTTLTGNVTLSGTLGVTGATTLTGAVSCPAGIAANITGNLSGSVGSLTGHTVQTGDNFARIGAAGASLSDLGGMSTAMKAEVQVEANDALIANNLDHLCLTAVANNADMSTEVVDGTIISNILSATSDTSTYVVSTDSLEAMSVVLATVTTTSNEQHNIETRTEVVDSG